MDGRDTKKEAHPEDRQPISDERMHDMLVHVFGVKMPADLEIPPPYSMILDDYTSSSEST